MKRAAMIILLFPVLAFGQTASRWDWQAWTINNGNPSPNGLYPVLAIPGATISICSGNPCTLATSYTDATATTPCGLTTQLTRGTSTACYGVADDQGGFGAWLLPGNYQYTISTNWGTFGPFPFGVDAAGAYCPISGGCTITGNLTVTGTINGTYYCPTTSTFADCYANLPNTGSIMMLRAGTYVAGSATPCLSTPNVSIIGAGTPQFLSDNSALLGGSIIQGTVFFCANNIAVSNLGVDVGSAWVSGGHSAADGLVFSGPTGTGADPILVGARITNVVGLGSAPTSPFHAIRVEHYSGVTLNNLEGRMAQHAIAIKSSNVNLNGFKWEGNSVDGIAVKSDDYTPQVTDINLQSLQGTWAATPGDTNGIQIEATGTTGVTSRVSVNTLTTNGVLADVSLTNSSGVGVGALSEVTLSNLNMTKINTSAGTPTVPTCMVSAGSAAPRDVHVIDGLCYINDPGQAVAPISFTLGITNLTIDNWTSIGSGFSSDIEGPNVTINGFRDYGAATAQPSINNLVSGTSVLSLYGWNSNRGNIAFSTTVGATGYVAPSAITMNSATGATVNINAAVLAKEYDSSQANSSDVFNTLSNTGSGAEYLSLHANSFTAVQTVTASPAGCWLAGNYGTADYGILDCSGGGLPNRPFNIAKNTPNNAFSLLSSGIPTFPAIAPSGCVQVDGSGHLSSTGVACAGGGGGGVTSIDGATGAFTFAGAVSHVGNAYTFTGGVTSVSGTSPVVSSGGATPAISMPAATTSVDGYLSHTDWNTFNGKQAALPSPVTITISSFSAAPNTCYNNTGGSSWTQSSGSPSPTTTTMTGLTTSMAPHWSPTSDLSQVVGWGAINGMILITRASASNTLSDFVCNVTASTIAQGGFTANVEP